METQERERGAMGRGQGRGSRGRRRRRWRRALAALAVACVGGVVGGELFARYWLGLGDPPLFVADPQIEYLNAPSRTFVRFGNRITYNRWSMRAVEFPQEKGVAEELRVLVLGDSVIHGGSLTDDDELATRMVQTRLASEVGRPVIVGNASAGSWGPPNLLAYVERFGLFDADIVLLVLNSDDAADVPSFSPLGVNQPVRSPVLALEELAMRYIPRFAALAVAGAGSEPVEEVPASYPPEDIDACVAALRRLVERARAHGAEVVIVQHMRRSEYEGAARPGHAIIAELARELSVPTHQTAPAFAAAVERGEDVFRDDIHPNGAGQRVLAEVIHSAIRSALPGGERPAEAAAGPHGG